MAYSLNQVERFMRVVNLFGFIIKNIFRLKNLLSVKYLLTLHGVRIAHIRTDVELSIPEVYLNQLPLKNIATK